jgi:hypothetical protein
MVFIEVICIVDRISYFTATAVQWKMWEFMTVERTGIVTRYEEHHTLLVF